MSFGGNWLPFILGVILLVVFGFIIPEMVLNISPPDTPTLINNSVNSPLVTFFDTGITIPLFFRSFNINPLAIFGQDTRNAVVNYLTSLTIYPSWFALPMIVIIGYLIIYGLIKIIIP